MKSTVKKYVSLFFVLVFAFSCFSLTVFAEDAETSTESLSFIEKIIVFFIGENAFVDGKFDFSSIPHVIYYKDSPMLMKIYDFFYEGFWNFLISVLNLFVK